jgi:hypothetical protein
MGYASGLIYELIKIDLFLIEFIKIKLIYVLDKPPCTSMALPPKVPPRAHACSFVCSSLHVLLLTRAHILGLLASLSPSPSSHSKIDVAILSKFKGLFGSRNSKQRNRKICRNRIDQTVENYRVF